MSTRARRGFALPAAMLALVVMGTLVTAAFYAVTQDFRRNRDGAASYRALGAAELGVYRAAATWPRERTLRFPVGASLPADTITVAPDAYTVVRLMRLNASTVWGAAEAVVGAATPMESRRRVGLALRFASPLLAPNAALTARGTVEVLGAATVSGVDAAPAGWVGDSLCPPPASVAAVAGPDTSRICDGGCGGGGGAARLVGTPPKLLDPLAGDSASYARFGRESWGSLAAIADVVLPPGATVTPHPTYSTGRCDAPSVVNWGDPARASPCGELFALIRAAGDLTIDGGVGQGILLVDGDLTVRGGAVFHGAVVVRGRLHTTGSGNAIVGAVLVASTDPVAAARIDGATRIVYSRCALDEAALASAPLVPLRSRAWIELF